jgi:hypothetical protein
MVVQVAYSGRRVAWLPEYVSNVSTHPSGRAWAGGVIGYVCMFTLEGNASPTS